MNPNLAQSLDPKLKEAYDRVMGTQINTKPQAAAAAVPQANPQPVNQAPAPEKQDTKVEMVSVNTSNSDLKTAPLAKKSKLSPVFLIAGGVAFFLVYTVIWLKVFKVF